MMRAIWFYIDTIVYKILDGIWTGIGLLIVWCIFG